MCSTVLHEVEWTTGARRRGRVGSGAAGAAGAPPVGAHAGVRRHGLPRGRGEVGAEPRPGIVARALPVDGQPVPGLLPRVRVLPRRADAGAARRRAHQPDRRPAGGRPGYGHQAGRRPAALRRHRRPGALVHDEARAPGPVDRWHRAGRERRAPVPHRTGVAARDGWLVPLRAAAAPAAGQLTARPRRPAAERAARRAAGGPRPAGARSYLGLPAGLSLWADPRRRRRRRRRRRPRRWW